MKRSDFLKSRSLRSCGSRRRARRRATWRKYGVSEATLYNWKAKYGGMDVSDAKRPKALEDENAKLKKLLADGRASSVAWADRFAATLLPVIDGLQRAVSPI